MTLKLQEFWDGNLPRETGRGEGKGHPQVQELQSVKFNLVSPGGSKSPGKHLVLVIARMIPKENQQIQTKFRLC